MLEAITSAVPTVIGWVGDVLSAIVTTEGELSAILPVIGLAIAFGVIGFGVRTIKNLTWGF